MDKQDKQDKRDKDKTMIIRNIPQDIKRMFKVACAQEGVTQQEKVVDLIRLYVSSTTESL